MSQLADGLFRFALEFARQPDGQLGFIAFGWLTMGQLLSAGILLAGAVLAVIVVSPARTVGPTAVAAHFP